MKVTVEIDAKWATLARSPLYLLVSSMTGVSVTFAPLFLYWAGQGKFEVPLRWVVVSLCFAVIYLIPLFYFSVGNAVFRELRNQGSSSSPNSAQKNLG